MKLFKKTDNLFNKIEIKNCNLQHDMSNYYCYLSESFDNLYDICIQNKIENKKVLIISDNKVYKLYSKDLINKIPTESDNIFHYLIKNNETSKQMDTVESIIQFLLKHNFSREDYMISLGGGVVGDITAFTASIFYRGIKYIHIPTSLLAQTDSAIGGKCGVNFYNVKNVIGSFYYPIFVYINTNASLTMNRQDLCYSVTEVIKSAIIKDSRFFNYLYKHSAENLSEKIFLYNLIYNAISIKKSYVEKDPYENNQIRTILNYGHTVGHGLEAISDYKITHGQAVAYGMIISNIISRNRGILSNDDFNKINECICKYLLIPDNHLTYKQTRLLFDKIKKDKKQTDKGLKFVIIEKIGKGILINDIEKKEILKAIQYYEHQEKN